MRKLIDLTGRTFGRLKVKARATNKGPYSCWLCKCSCGNKTVVMGKDLQVGDTRSCGCLAKEWSAKLGRKFGKIFGKLFGRGLGLKYGPINGPKTRTHGGSGSLTYWSWYNMIDRCYNPKATGYSSYGGRGITVCDRWRDKRNGYRNFLTDKKPRPSKDHCIDRINPDGNYIPRNCRWVTKSFNARRARKGHRK